MIGEARADSAIVEEIMRRFFCQCAYCQRQNRAVLNGLLGFFSAIRWLIAPPRLGKVKVPVRIDEE